MANENRVRGNLVSGTLNGALTNVATSMTAANLANLPVVGATQHAVIVIENELVYVTAHTGGATTATILRGQEGTTAAAHNNGVAWTHAPVVSDFDSVLGSAQAVVNQTGVTTEVDLTSLAVAVVVPYAQHRIRVTGYCPSASNSLATGGAVMNIKEGATRFNTGATMAPVANFGLALFVSAVFIPTTGSHTYKLTGAAGNGGTAAFGCAADAPMFLLVEDLGPAL